MTARTILAALASLATLACGGSDGGPTDNNPPPGDVIVGNNIFTPANFSVAANGTVSWAWNSAGIQHNVTFDDGQHSSTQGSGTYQRTFATAGSFPYHCTIHPETMQGTITVTAAGTGTQTGGGSGGGGGGAYGLGM